MYKRSTSIITQYRPFLLFFVNNLYIYIVQQIDLWASLQQRNMLWLHFVSFGTVGLYYAKNMTSQVPSDIWSEEILNLEQSHAWVSKMNLCLHLCLEPLEACQNKFYK